MRGFRTLGRRTISPVTPIPARRGWRSRIRPGKGTHNFLQFRKRILRRSVQLEILGYDSRIFGINLNGAVCTIVAVAKRSTARISDRAAWQRAVLCLPPFHFRNLGDDLKFDQQIELVLNLIEAD